MVALPASGVTSPSSIRSVVVLPAPFGPRNPVIDPWSTVKLRSSTAVTAPKRIVNHPPSRFARLASSPCDYHEPGGYNIVNKIHNEVGPRSLSDAEGAFER